MSTNMPLSLANGRYQLNQLIGRGGMAQVYVAQDTRLGRIVAVKIMRSDLANDEIFLKRFRREAHAVAQMNNVNIVNIYDSGEETFTDEDGTTECVPYIVMEYVKGQTLRDILKANGALSQRDSEQVMLGVLNALDYSHRMGVIHRDIKPGNIMISDQGIVKVMDFGIARALDDSAATMTQSQGVVGTAQYLSPEQARGESVDMRSDLYSAGCVLYEMLTGRAPFNGDSAVAIAYQHVSEVATPPSTIVPGLPKMWNQICAKAMAKDRQNRYSTAAEFRNDILTYMNGGVPVAAAFNPLTDLSNMKQRKQADEAAATEALNPVETTATQAFDPLTGTFGAPTSPTATATTASRVAQREAEDKKRKKKRNIIIGSVVGGLVVLMAALGIGYGIMHKNKVEMVTVPTFTSTTTEDLAREKLTEAGLKMKVEKDTNSSEPAGTLTNQSPKGGKKAAKGSTVKVWFSTGPQSVQVPDVKGKSQEEARAILTKAGFKVSTSTKTEDSGDVAKNQVTRTDPAAGTAATKNTLLTLYISSGMTKLPDVTGQPQDQAVNSLTGAHFNVVVKAETSDTVDEGRVTRTDPGAGATVPQQSTVTVYVSQGKPQVQVPNISYGTKYSVAKAQLEAAGFHVSVNPGDPTDDNAIVVGISPSSGSVPKGSTITVTTKEVSTNNGTSGSSSTGSPGTAPNNGRP
jgi:eukaryotic-like serine/threonine-protein kinase